MLSAIMKSSLRLRQRRITTSPQGLVATTVPWAGHDRLEHRDHGQSRSSSFSAGALDELAGQLLVTEDRSAASSPSLRPLVDLLREPG
jgi:hypothetical protein